MLLFPEALRSAFSNNIRWPTTPVPEGPMPTFGHHRHRQTLGMLACPCAHTHHHHRHRHRSAAVLCPLAPGCAVREDGKHWGPHRQSTGALIYKTGTGLPSHYRGQVGLSGSEVLALQPGLDLADVGLANLCAGSLLPGNLSTPRSESTLRSESQIPSSPRLI